MMGTAKSVFLCISMSYPRDVYSVLSSAIVPMLPICEMTVNTRDVDDTTGSFRITCYEKLSWDIWSNESRTTIGHLQSFTEYSADIP